MQNTSTTGHYTDRVAGSRQLRVDQSPCSSSRDQGVGSCRRADPGAATLAFLPPEPPPPHSASDPGTRSGETDPFQLSLISEISGLKC